MNHLPKPTLVKSLPIEEIPNINSKWKCKLDNTIIIIKDIKLVYDKLFIKYNFINSNYSIYEKYTKFQFHKKYIPIDC